MKSGSHTAWIVERASALGFDLCGVVRAEKFPELELIKEWLAEVRHGTAEFCDFRCRDWRKSCLYNRDVQKSDVVQTYPLEAIYGG